MNIATQDVSTLPREKKFIYHSLIYSSFQKKGTTSKVTMPINRPIKRPENPSQSAPPTTQTKAATGGIRLDPRVVSQGLRILSTIPTNSPRIRRMRAEELSPFRKAIRENRKATGEAPMTGMKERMMVMKNRRKNSPIPKRETPLATKID